MNQGEEASSSPDSAAIISPMRGIENASERNLVSVTGATIVTGPEFLQIIQQAQGDGLGTKTFDMRNMLHTIAMGKASISDLMKLAEKYKDMKHESDLILDLQSAAESLSFIDTGIRFEFHQRGIPFPGVWKKVVMLNGQPYGICSLNKPQNNIFETVMGIKRGTSDVPRYDGGVLDGYNATCNVESKKHTTLGSLAQRLSLIIDYTRTKASEDIIANPNEIDVGMQINKEFPNGRLFTVVKKKLLSVVT